MGLAGDPDIADDGGSAERDRPDVVKLEVRRGGAAPSVRADEGAAAAVAAPDLPADRRGDGGARRRSPFDSLGLNLPSLPRRRSRPLALADYVVAGLSSAETSAETSFFRSTIRARHPLPLYG